jgi:hypothetical protein
VIGTITPPACNIAITGAGVFDVGEVALNLTGVTNTPPAPPQTLSVTCNEPANVAFKITDNKSSTLSANLVTDHRIGIGTDASSHNLGWANFLSSSVQTDGGPGVLKSTKDKATWNAVADNALMDVFNVASTMYSFDKTSSGATAVPPAITTGTVVLTLDAQVAARSSLDLSSKITFDGSATFELIYL